MIIPSDYNSLKYNIKYLFLKYLPVYFYPFVLSYYYEQKFKRKLNLKNPQRLSEKILWSVLYDNNPMKTVLADKLKAKEYVSAILPDLKAAKVFQIAFSFNDININKAPDTFVIKTNHAWRTHILVKDKNKITKEDYNFYKKFYKKVLNINYAYWGTPELQYENIEPKVYLEEYLYAQPNREGDSFIKEYEVFCFNGKPEFINYSKSLNDTEEPLDRPCKEGRCFDTHWAVADYNIMNNDDIKEPDTINKDLIIYYAEILSTGFDFVRIDFFEIDNELYFGEFTFSPYAGFIQFLPDEYDLFFGQKLKIRKD